MCSLASLLFLRFGLLPLFSPGPPTKKPKKKIKSSSKLSKLLRKVRGRAKGEGTAGPKAMAPVPPLVPAEEKAKLDLPDAFEGASKNLAKEQPAPEEAPPPNVFWMLGPVEPEEFVQPPLAELPPIADSRAKSEQQHLEKKKRKKSFKICQCIPRSETLEEIRLPSSANQQPEKPRALIMSSNSGSRFRIIPVENNYKRGRWQVWDFYEGAEIQKSAFLLQPNKSPPFSGTEDGLTSPESPEKRRSICCPASPTPPGSQPPLPRRNSFQLVTIKGLEERRCSASVPASISEERLNLVAGEQGSPSILSRDHSGTPPPPPQIVEPESARRIDWAEVSPGPAARPAALSPAGTTSAASEMLSSIQQQFGLEHGLCLGLDQQSGNVQPQQPHFSASFGPGQLGQQMQQRRAAAALLMRRNSSASTGAAPSGQKVVDAGVAIDSKIEQAMDLVKTHLIYAVRDEIELLRTRIAELEGTVAQLELENAVLREHVPRQVLASLGLDAPALPLGAVFANVVPTAALAQ